VYLALSLQLQAHDTNQEVIDSVFSGTLIGCKSASIYKGAFYLTSVEKTASALPVYWSESPYGHSRSVAEDGSGYVSAPVRGADSQ